MSLSHLIDSGSRAQGTATSVASDQPRIAGATSLERELGFSVEPRYWCGYMGLRARQLYLSASRGPTTGRGLANVLHGSMVGFQRIPSFILSR